MQAIWNALMTARHDCEVMAARGVRVVKDVSRDWQVGERGRRRGWWLGGGSAWRHPLAADAMRALRQLLAAAAPGWDHAAWCCPGLVTLCPAPVPAPAPVQETVADLIDKVVATENDMALLRQQLERERSKRQAMQASGRGRRCAALCWVA
jgi:hypothetical protein